MNKLSEFGKGFSQKGLKILLAIIIAIGVIVRFADLGEKVYTVDEIIGLLRLSGYTDEAFIEQVYVGKVLTAQEILSYQKPNPRKTLKDAINALSTNPEHPPLYYVTARFWMQMFNTPVGSRTLAVIVGILILPCIYWLCLELFQSSVVGWMAVSLVAISPIHITLAQEARQYSFWTVATLVSSSLLLRTLRLQTLKSWGFYTLSLIFGIYCHLFFIWVIVTHGLYVWLIESLRFSQAVRRYLISVVLTFIGFLPWLWVILTQLSRTKQRTSWVSSYKATFLERLEFWLHNSSLIFVDFNQEVDWTNPIPYITLLLLSYATYYLCRHTSKRVWLFVLLLMSVTAISQVLPDMLFNGRRSMLYRYLLPSYLGIELAVAYLLAATSFGIAQQAKRRWIWRTIAVCVVSFGVLSSFLIAQAKDWDKGSGSLNLDVASILNRSHQPLAIADANYRILLSLVHLVNPSVEFQIFQSEDSHKKQPTFTIPKLADRTNRDLFVYFSSKEFVAATEKVYGVPLEVVVDESRWFPGIKCLYKVPK
jgi:uncharacterized membrane protein